MEQPMRAGKETGAIYLVLLFAVAMLSITLAVTGSLWSLDKQRQNEARLIFVGNEYRKAIQLYYQSTPGYLKKYPQKLEDLLQDNRHLSIRRYLRKIYPDPITRSYEWGLVRAPDGGIMGVFSLSQHKPLAVVGGTGYQDWKFIFTHTEQ